uniref:Uncharacterized protein n=1 Tax=Hordeum vulgare subsp. vulgare TaxID=112509 RepID=A0A023IND7_HORVV|nr:hypothetical protein [Hordeum vulgare subsp. vulgare]
MASGVARPRSIRDTPTTGGNTGLEETAASIPECTTTLGHVTILRRPAPSWPSTGSNGQDTSPGGASSEATVVQHDDPTSRSRLTAAPSCEPRGSILPGGDPNESV